MELNIIAEWVIFRNLNLEFMALHARIKVSHILQLTVRNLNTVR